MVDQVNLVSVDGRKVPEWAMEDTLQDIRELLQTQVQYLQQDTARGGQERIKERRETEKSSKLNQKQTGILANIWKRLGGLTGFTARLIKAVIAGGASIETVFKKTAQRMIESISEMGGGPVSNVFGLTVTALIGTVTLLTKRISDASESFRALYDTGFSLGGQLGNLYIEAGKSAMTLNEYSQALEGHSTAVKGLTNQFERGEIVFGQYSRGVRELLLAQGQLLLSTSELNDYLGEYLETQRLQGRLDQFDRMREQRYMSDYLKTLTELTRISGKRREQIFEEVQAFARRVDVSNVLATVPQDVASAFNQLVEGVTAVGPDILKEGLAQLFAFGTFTTQETAILRQIPGLYEEMASAVQKAKSGVSLTSDEMATWLGEMQNHVENLKNNTSLMETFAKAQLTGVGNFQQLNEVMQAFLGLNLENIKNMRDENDALLKLIGNWNTLMNKVLDPFNQLLGRTINTLARLLGEKGITQKVIAAFDSVYLNLTSLLTNKNLESAIDWLLLQFVRVTEFLANLFTSEGREEIKKNLQETIEDIGKWMGETIVDSLVGALTPGFLKSAEERKPGEPHPSIIERDRVRDELKRERDKRKIEELENEINNLKQRKEGGHPSTLRGIEKQLENKDKELNILRRRVGTHPTEWARGGVANMPSIFGEKGPEAAIPLDTGKRIPIAEIKGDFNKKELKTIADSMGKFLERQSMVIEQNEKMIKRLDKVSSTISRSGERIG